MSNTTGLYTVSNWKKAVAGASTLGAMIEQVIVQRSTIDIDAIAVAATEFKTTNPGKLEVLRATINRTKVEMDGKTYQLKLKNGTVKNNDKDTIYCNLIEVAPTVSKTDEEKAIAALKLAIKLKGVDWVKSVTDKVATM